MRPTSATNNINRWNHPDRQSFFRMTEINAEVLRNAGHIVGRRGSSA